MNLLTTHAIIFLLITKGLYLNLCHLYHKVSSYQYLDTLLNSFENFQSIDIAITESIENYDVYLIEIHDADKDISFKLKKIFNQKKSALIYFIIPKNYTILLFQLTYLLSTKAIFTETQNVQKIVSKIISDEKVFMQKDLQMWLGHVKMSTQKFLIYTNKKLQYISHELIDTFKCTTEEVLELQILPQIDIDWLLTYDDTFDANIKDVRGSEANFNLKSLSISESDTLIYIDKNTCMALNNDVFTSRFSFIETLKEKVLERDISELDISLLSISIENTKELLQELGIVEYENRFHDLLIFMESSLNDRLIFSQFENNFYVVLFEDISIEDLAIIARDFSTKISTYKKNKEFQVSLDIFSLHLNNREFSEILSILESFHDKSFSFTPQNIDYIKNISGRDIKISAKDFLDDAYTSNIKLKTLNIYHGLVINTSIKIVKITLENIYIKFESLQGIVLENERKTVLQSPSFSQDILADVKQINLSTKVAILENFTFLKTNANARMYARVTPSRNTPVTMHSAGRVVNGIVLDLSIKSIAISVKYSISQVLIKRTRISVVFNLPSKNAVNGYVQLSLDATIILITEVDTMGYYKVVCDLEQEVHDINVISQYVYERQKELIIELKKISKLN